MESSDIPEVLNIERRLHEVPWSPKIFEDGLRVGFDCWVLVQDQAVIGYYVTHTRDDQAHILNLGVDTPWQGKGLGKVLLHQALEQARLAHCTEVSLEVAPSNTVAVNLYLRDGFRKFATKHAYYERKDGTYENAWVLVKALDR